MTARVACCQFAPEVGDLAGNAARCRGAIAAAVADGAQIVVLPELANSGYVFKSDEEARAAAVSVEDGLLGDWAGAAGDALVIGGFCELAPDGRLFNSVALVGADGREAVYRKIHLWDEEQRWFAAGEEPAPVVQTRYGRVGLAICYDIEFPELTRGLALEGAELLAIPSNWPRNWGPPDGRPVLHSLAAMTAYLNRVFVAVCDRSGAERGCEFEGGSVIANPDGALCAGPVADHGAETIIADCDLALARDKRTSGRNDAFADRRPERYVPALVGNEPFLRAWRSTASSASSS